MDVTAPRRLLPEGLTVTGLLAEPDALKIRAATEAPYVRCPVCGGRSARVHSRYGRTVADLSWRGLAVKLEVRARKFFCDEPSCERRIFCERLPEVAARARKTGRLEEALLAIVFELGGRAGARLAAELGLVVGRDALLSRAREVVPAPHRPRARHQHVHADEPPRAGAAGAQGVELDPLLPIAALYPLYEGQVLRGEGGVQQAMGGLVQDAQAHPHDVRGHQQRDQGVQNQPPRRAREQDAGHHPGRGPHVGEEVPPVGAQRRRAEPAARPQQHQPHRAVEGGGHERDDEAHPDVLQRLRLEQASDRRRRDERGGPQDQGSFKGAREELGLGVAVGVSSSGGRAAAESAQKAPTAASRLAEDSAASERSPAEPVSPYAALSPTVASAAAIDTAA